MKGAELSREESTEGSIHLRAHLGIHLRPHLCIGGEHGRKTEVSLEVSTEKSAGGCRSECRVEYSPPYSVFNSGLIAIGALLLRTNLPLCDMEANTLGEDRGGCGCVCVYVGEWGGAKGSEFGGEYGES